MQKIIYFTKEGYKELRKKYDELLLSRPESVSELAKARAMGDLSENGYYKSARMKLSDVDRRLRQLKYQIQYGKVKEFSHVGIVDIGCFVTLRTGNSTKTYAIVGTYEANPSEGKISAYSPLGKILMGKRKGEKAVLHVGNRTTEFFVQSIR